MDPIIRAGKIKEALFVRGLSFADVDRKYELPAKTAYTTLREPNQRGEEALAETLALEPKELWPERYDAASGQRFSPQPSNNYRRPSTMRQRRNVRAA